MKLRYILLIIAAAIVALLIAANIYDWYKGSLRPRSYITIKDSTKP